MKRIFTLSLFAISFVSVGQDSLARKVIPAIYFDYGKGLSSMAPDNLRLEGSAEIIISGRWQFVTEIGYWNLKPNSAIENGFYQVRGTYNRYGFGFLPLVAKDSRFGVGIRYANSKYRDRGNYMLTSEIQPDLEVNFKRIKQSATWYELVIYSDKEMNNWLTAGFNLRMRFGLTYDQQEPVDIYTIPGYGRAQDKIAPAVNLFLKIPF